MENRKELNNILSELDQHRIGIIEARKRILALFDVSNFVLLAKPNYKAKDGTIKRGIEIDGKYYAPQNDC